MKVEEYAEYKEDLIKAMFHHGKDAQIDHTVEEMEELKVELRKYQGGAKNYDELVEEIADVLNMLNQLILGFGCKADVEWQQRAKMHREAARLNIKRVKTGGSD